jgi:hypothetical protein
MIDASLFRLSYVHWKRLNGVFSSVSYPQKKDLCKGCGLFTFFITDPLCLKLFQINPLNVIQLQTHISLPMVKA